MTAPISANSTVNIEIEDSCNNCCCRPNRWQRAKKQSAHSATLKQIQDREIAEGQTAKTTQKADGVVKEVLGYKVAE